MNPNDKENNVTQQNPQPPVTTYRMGAVSGAVWANLREEEDGQSVVRHSVKIKRRYRDPQTGEYRDSDYFFPDDLPYVWLIAKDAFRFVKAQESGEDDSPVAG